MFVVTELPDSTGKFPACAKAMARKIPRPRSQPVTVLEYFMPNETFSPNGNIMPNSQLTTRSQWNSTPAANGNLAYLVNDLLTDAASTLASGTGKTFIAFQLAWKLFQSRCNLSREPSRSPRILFLADRNILANQAFNAFSSGICISAGQGPSSTDNPPSQRSPNPPQLSRHPADKQEKAAQPVSEQAKLRCGESGRNWKGNLNAEVPFMDLPALALEAVSVKVRFPQRFWWREVPS